MIPFPPPDPPCPPLKINLQDVPPLTLILFTKAAGWYVLTTFNNKDVLSASFLPLEAPFKANIRDRFLSKYKAPLKETKIAHPPSPILFVSPRKFRLYIPEYSGSRKGRLTRDSCPGALSFIRL